MASSFYSLQNAEGGHKADTENLQRRLLECRARGTDKDQEERSKAEGDEAN